MVNVIHLRGTEWSESRYNSFTKEMNEQGVNDYKIWDGIHDTNRVRGINLAHKQIVKDAKEKGLPEVCIAEDDIIFLDKGAFDYFIQNKPKEYHLYLGGISDRIKIDGDRIVDFRGLTLYYVHENFYDKYLSVSDDINIDSAMKGLGDFYLCNKVVCSQRAGYSYHKRRHTDYSNKLKQYNLYGGQ